MTRYSFGSVVLVPFPFTDQTASKQRPAVVISSREYNDVRPDVIVMAITSQLRAADDPFESMLDAWREAGLLKPSAIKPVIATLEKALVKRTLGELGDGDRRALRGLIAGMLG
jgi:mRNA interferase MazF